MGLWSEGVSKSLSNLKIEDGILIKCTAKEGSVIIPDDLKGVAEDAFEGCENVKLNYTQKYVENYLQDTLTEIMNSLEADIKEGEDIDEDNVILVFDINSEIIEEGVKRAIFLSEFSEEEWNLKEIEASKIQDICNQMDSTDYDMTQEGFGILLIKNLTKEIYENLPNNFIYNLLRNHKFYKKDISEKWIIMIEIGDGVRIPASDFAGNAIQGGYFYNIPPKQYMKEMGWANKIIKREEIPSESEGNPSEKATSKKEEGNSIGTNKEIDWEERRFQICLALISRADLTSYHNNTVATREINPKKIIMQADKMIEELKKSNY